MASIPLHCNICPKSPDFSDVSHLLTHVASKGHLFHYFRAQVNAAQDEVIRHKLEVFDQWFDDYQIGRLLSQRMKSKESRDLSKPKNTTKDQKSANPARPIKHRVRRNNVDRQPSPSPVKTEERIDPRLASNDLPLRSHLSFQESPSQEAALRHRAHVPRMLDWQKNSPNNRTRSSSLPAYQRSPLATLRSYDRAADDGESDYFRLFIRSPSRPVYPEPPNFSAFKSESVHPQTDSDDGKDMRSVSPILKGVKYPGMSLFDSASEQAQRLRNQKKDSSVLDQMVLDSAAIEPMEHIYWPEGGLKKSRVITGNVESSPIKEPTPPPKRRRTRAGRVLTDSTATQKLGRKRGRKPGKATDTGVTSLRSVAGTALVTLRTVYPRNAHMGYSPVVDEAHDISAAKGSPVYRRKARFPVFRDPSEPTSQAHTQARSKEKLSSENVLLPRDPNRKSALPPSYSYPTKSFAPPGTRDATFPPQSRRASSSLHLSPCSTSQGLIRHEDRENEVLFNDSVDVPNDNIDKNEPDRVTQRYFSVVGNQPPQFFSSMPPQMDFGGVGGPAYCGTSLNPLNPFLGRHYQQSHFAPAMFVRQDATVSSLQHQIHPASGGEN